VLIGANKPNTANELKNLLIRAGYRDEKANDAVTRYIKEDKNSWPFVDNRTIDADPSIFEFALNASTEELNKVLPTNAQKVMAEYKTSHPEASFIALELWTEYFRNF